MIDPDLTKAARAIAYPDNPDVPPKPPADPLVEANYADPAARQDACRAALFELKYHYQIMERLLKVCAAEAEAAAAAGKRSYALAMTKAAVQVQGAAGRCLASAISLTNQIGQLEGESQLRQAAARLGAGPRRPLVSEDDRLTPLARGKSA